MPLAGRRNLVSLALIVSAAINGKLHFDGFDALCLFVLCMVGPLLGRFLYLGYRVGEMQRDHQTLLSDAQWAVEATFSQASSQANRDTRKCNRPAEATSSLRQLLVAAQVYATEHDLTPVLAGIELTRTTVFAVMSTLVGGTLSVLSRLFLS